HVAGDPLTDVVADGGPVRGVGELLDGDAARELLVRVPEDLAQLRVRVDDATVLHHVDACDRLLDQRAKAVLAGSQGLLARGRGGRYLLRPAHSSLDSSSRNCVASARGKQSDVIEA